VAAQGMCVYVRLAFQAKNLRLKTTTTTTTTTIDKLLISRYN